MKADRTMCGAYPKIKDVTAMAVFLVAFIFAAEAQENSRNQEDDLYWKVNREQDAIVWDLTGSTRLPHADDIEMSGEKISSIISYAVNRGKYVEVTRDLIFPQLRRYLSTSEPEWQEYRAYFRKKFDDAYLPSLVYKNMVLDPQLDSVIINGKLNFYHRPVEGIHIVRTIFPSTTERLLVEKWKIRNISEESKNLHIGHSEMTISEMGMYGEYTLKIYCDADNELNLAPQEEYSYGIYFSAAREDEGEVKESHAIAEAGRNSFLEELKTKLVLKTPDPVLNTLFYFSKIRASESIFDTKMGLVHSPGGGNYYAGIWANDQVEYSGPFFPYLGYSKGNKAAYNAYVHFLNNIPEDGSPIKSSFEMEGDLPCCSKDRGDAAMICYGTSQFVLASGDKNIAAELWPLIEWSIRYCNSRLNEHGVVLSDTDEMEGRIPTGDANLSTSSLYYGGLIQAVRVAEILGKKPSLIKDYAKKARALRQAIEDHFGANVEGIETYRYFEGHTGFRHWICLPLVMDINDRKEGTLKALFDVLWTDQGVLVEPGDEVFWDRGTLYAFRGAFKAGAADEALKKLIPYSRTRLLGRRVPYVVEAYPEYGMRHLSAESALYCRAFTEGMMGIEPTGLNKFRIKPQVPLEWNGMSLLSCCILNRNLDFHLTRNDGGVVLQVTDEGKPVWHGQINNGDAVEIKL